MMLLTLRGTPFLYYGDEIGLPDVPLDPADALDPVPRRTGKPERNRDPCRTPMQWTAEPGAGFTEAGVETWLPIGDAAAHNVADQRDDARLAAAPHARPDRAAPRAARPARRRLRDAARARRARGRGGAARATRSRSTSPTPRSTVEGLRGRVAIATDRARDGEAVDGALTLGAVAGRRDRDVVSVEGLDALLSPEGWVYASTPPVAEGDPGRYHALFGRDSLITALQVLPARPDVARGDAARAGGAPGAARRPGDRRGAGQDPPRVPARGARVAHRARLAGARRRAALLRLGRLDPVVPRAARGARRRRADGGARGRLARGRRVARARARAPAAGVVRYGPRERSGGLTQQGWRDVMGPATEDDDGGGIVRPDGSTPRAAAGRHRRRRPSPTRRCARSRVLSGEEAWSAARRGARGAARDATSAPA